MDMNQLMALLIAQGQKWIKEQREAFRPKGRKLPDAHHRQFSPFFEIVAPASGAPGNGAGPGKPQIS